MYIAARQLTIDDLVSANGNSGQTVPHGGGGGGAGGSIWLTARDAAIGSGLIVAVGNSGGLSTQYGTNGGAGGVGRIRIEYCNSLSGSTNPPASTQQLDCYIVEQVESPPYTTARINIPESFTGGRTYKVQYGRRHVFDSAGNWDATLRIPVGAFDSVTLDTLVSEADSGSITFKLDVGGDGSWDWQATQSIIGPVTLSSPDLSDTFNQYWTDQGAPTSGTLDVPIKVFLSEPGQVILTNLYVPPAPADATLTAANISFNNTAPTTGDHVTIQAVVSNTEALTAKNIIVAFFAGDPQVDGVYIGADFLPVIPGNGTATATLDWDTEGFGGNIDLYVILDLTNRVIEADENNNSAFKSIRVQMKNKVFLPVILRNYSTPRMMQKPHLAGIAVQPTQTWARAGLQNA